MHTIRTVNVLGTSAMEVFLFTPPSTGPHPGIVLAQHIPIGHTGVENDEFTIKTAERFAQRGFAVAVPFLFHWWDKSAEMDVKRRESRDDWMVADMQGAFGTLADLEDVDAARIGVVGHCWGGRVAWLAACHMQELKACAVFYGGRIKLGMGDNQPPPIDLCGNITCPMAGFFGNDDENPSPADVDDYARALSVANVSHTFYRYDDAGHAFQNAANPQRYRKTQSEDAWAKVVDFLAKAL